jgi:hypothetical protein
MTKENYIKGKLEGLQSIILAVKLLKSSSIKNNIKMVPIKNAENGIILEESNYKIINMTIAF